MFPQDGYVNLVVARLFDFVSRRSPWQRRLWSVGTILQLREVVEYSQVVEQGLSEEGLKYVAERAREHVEADHGVPTSVVEAVRDALDFSTVKTAAGRTELEVLTDRAEDRYLTEWRAAVVDVSEPEKPSVERLARGVVSHLLDGGFHPDQLHRWLTWLQEREETITIRDLLDEAIDLSQRPKNSYSVLVPFEALPDEQPPPASPFERLDGPQTTAWIGDRDASHVRYVASLLVEVKARDRSGAVQAAEEIVSRVVARATVGHPGKSAVAPSGVAYLEDSPNRFDLREPRRQVEAHAVSRQGALFDVAGYQQSSMIDDAIELASSLERGAPGAAISGGWAAVEGLLSRPGVRGDAVNAADRLAALAAASWPRAELTTLSYRHSPATQDVLAQRLSDTATNRERCQLLEAHFKSGGGLSLSDDSDLAAERRMISLLQEPHGTLQEVRGFIQDSIRRLYNQRNLVMHAGSLRSVALDATLRTTPPVIGAGLDRIVHASLASGGEISPLKLAARAEAELGLISSEAATDVSDLLE